MKLFDRTKNLNNLRVIKTARSIKQINQAVDEGFRPLMKKVEPSEKIRSKYWVLQDPKTQKVKYVSDARAMWRLKKHENYIILIDQTWEYPYNWPNSFAAYLIPKDLEKSERVFLEDLIEDYVGLSWNQGHTFRLPTCEAIWNGTDFEIQYDPKEHIARIMG